MFPKNAKNDIFNMIFKTNQRNFCRTQEIDWINYWKIRKILKKNNKLDKKNEPEITPV